jgi:hypothetical protein
MDVFKEFKSVIVTLEREQIPYALCGGLAVGVHAEPRATKDIDILLLTEDVERTKQALLSCGFKFFSTPMFFADSQIELHKLTKIDRNSGDYIFLDLVMIKSPEAPKVWESRQRLVWENQSMWVVSREWLIWMKKLRSSPLDLIDIEALEKLP